MSDDRAKVQATVSMSLEQIIANAVEWIGMVAADGSTCGAAQTKVAELMRMVAGTVRYEKDGSRIEVGCSAREQEDSALRQAVRDARICDGWEHIVEGIFAREREIKEGGK